MAIVFACACGRELSAPDAAKGLKAKCPRCQATLRVPAILVSRPHPTETESWRLLVSQAKGRFARGTGLVP
jgi:phage FluMu protein Com